MSKLPGVVFGSAPVAQPRTRLRGRNALRPARDWHLARVRDFSCQECAGFRLPLTACGGFERPAVRSTASLLERGLAQSTGLRHPVSRGAIDLVAIVAEDRLS